MAIVLVLLAAGVGGFWYLGVSSPLALLAGGDRTIAAATAFIPEQSPLTLSLLTKPDKLVALQQALISPERQQSSLADVQQLKQNLSDRTGLDYDRDIQPWIGDEVTVAFTEQDLDLDASNGDQPGYAVVVEIAGDRIQQARAFLQVFWQRQTLAGAPPIIEQVSGVRVLYSQSASSARGATSSLTGAAPITMATALVGDQFVMFANDVRVLKRSIRSAQTATNLAQNRQYRQAVNQLDESRLGLAYINTTAIGDIGSVTPKKSQQNKAQLKNRASENRASENWAVAAPHFVAIGLGLTEKGVIANALLPQNSSAARVSTQPLASGLKPQDMAASESMAALRFLPSNSAIAISSRDLSQLAQALTTYGIAPTTLPDFLTLSPSGTTSNQSKNKAVLHASLWQWASGHYALGRVGNGTSSDWILAIERQDDGVTQLDQAAIELGYSTVPVTLENGPERGPGSGPESGLEIGDGLVEATAWTRLKARTGGRSKSRAGGRYGQAQGSSSLETEVLALHVQQNGYEIFASSVGALESALMSNGLEPEGSQGSLLGNPRFQQAIAAFPRPNNGYFYTDWPAIASEAADTLPILSLLESAARPIVAHLDTLAATRQGNAAKFLFQLTRPTVAANAYGTGPSRNLTSNSNRPRRPAPGNAYR
ncbi:MAG: DUF3352 domain-containing protein [Cyanobacteria bacterium J06598_3]